MEYKGIQWSMAWVIDDFVGKGGFHSLLTALCRIQYMATFFRFAGSVFPHMADVS